jgi:hypothetical protein
MILKIFSPFFGEKMALFAKTIASFCENFNIT